MRTNDTQRQTRIHLSSPDITELEEEAVLRALRSGWIAPVGPEIDAFERELADYCGRAHAVALSSGTAALHLALIGLGLGPGDLVLTSTMTFAATANAVKYTGADPVFVDCDETGNMDPDVLALALEDLSSRGIQAKALLTVDLLGKVAKHEQLGVLAQQHGIPVLVDAAESLGARRQGRPAGSHGLASVISFNGNKIATTSGGGALLTDDPGFADKARYLSTQARQPVRHYEHVDIGYNYRLSNILAAIGRVQLQRLENMITIRTAHRHRYQHDLATIPGVRIFGEPSSEGATYTRDNCWITSITLDNPRALRDRLIEHLDSLNIEARPLWKPMHLQPVFRGSKAYSNGTSQRLFESGVSLPSSSALSAAQIDRVASAVLRFFQRTSETGSP